MKTILKILAGLLLVVILAIVGFVYTFDANNYKEELTGIIKSSIERDIEIKGNINLSVYPWIGITAEDLIIKNKPGFKEQTFANVKQFDIKIKPLPLIQDRLEIDKIIFNQATLRLEINTAGNNNWSDIITASKSNNVGSDVKFTYISIGGIEIVDSDISWLDNNTGKEFKLSDLTLTTEALVQNQPLPIELKARIKSNQPEWDAAFLINTKIDINNDSDTFNAKDMRLSANTIFPNSSIDKLSFSIAAHNTQVNIKTHTAQFSKAQVQTLGLLMYGDFDAEKIFSVPGIQGPLEIKPFSAYKLAEQLKTSIQPVNNPDSLKNISLKAMFKTDFITTELNEISANIDASRVQGYIHIKNETNQSVRYDLKLDEIQAQDYIAKSDQTNTNEFPLPLNFLKTVDLKGKLKIETAHIGDTELREFTIISAIKNGIVKANPIVMTIGDSKVKAALQLNANSTPRGMVVVKANNIDTNAALNPWLKTILGDEAIIIKGKVSTDARLKISGTSINKLKQSAQGTVKININKMILSGLDLDHASRTVVVDYANKNNFITRKSYAKDYRPNNETEFDRLKATLTFTPGKISNKDLVLTSKEANIKGSGNIDLKSKKLNYHLQVDMNVKKPIDIRDKLRDHPMGYNLQGEFENITTTFDYKKYDLLVSRMLLIEAKAKKIRRINKKNGNSWTNSKSSM